tara:strand:+ start:144 stop:1475 length:1332 start_codon:yes stop_codon:yes gene_type:complete
MSELSSPGGQPLIIDDAKEGIFRVHRLAYASDELFEREQREIYDHCWLLLGHESEISQPGDFKTRTIALRPIIFCRDDAGEVRAFINSCPHRGAELCHEIEGNRSIFQCMYHSWTFKNTGEVHTVRAEDGFTGGFRLEAFSLKEVPRIEIYRDFVFICFDPDAPDLVTYLGNVARYIDFLADQGGDGMEIVEGTQLYAARANWKLQMENVIDFYHTVPLHTSYFRFLEGTGTDISGGVGGASYDLGNGHSAVHFKAPWGRPVARWEARWGEAEKVRLEALRADIQARIGPERAEMVCDWDCNILVFPNLTVADVVALVVRVVNPITPDMMEITQWCLAPKGEPEEARARRLHAFNTFLGPGGFATPDDIEVFEGSQRAFGAHRELPWSDFSRGYYGEATRPEAEVQSDYEGQHRAFYREWARRINGRISDRVDLAALREAAAE